MLPQPFYGSQLVTDFFCIHLFEVHILVIETFGITLFNDDLLLAMEFINLLQHLSPLEVVI